MQGYHTGSTRVSQEAQRAKEESEQETLLCFLQGAMDESG